MPHPLTLQN